MAMSRTTRSKRSSPVVSVAKATRRWSALTVSAPMEKNSLSPASTLPSTTTCSPSAGPPSGSGRTAASVRGTRTCERYWRPSVVREKYHQGPLATGTDRSVSLTRERISSKRADRSPARWAVRSSAYAFSASRWVSSSGSSRSFIHA